MKVFSTFYQTAKLFYRLTFVVYGISNTLHEPKYTCNKPFPVILCMLPSLFNHCYSVGCLIIISLQHIMSIVIVIIHLGVSQ